MDALGINLWGLIAQIVNFAAICYLLNRFAYIPLRKLMMERRMREMHEVALAMHSEREVVLAMQELEARLAESIREIDTHKMNIEKERERVVAEAREEARALADKIMAEARGKASRISAMTTQERERLIEDALDRFREELRARDERVVVTALSGRGNGNG